MSIKFFSFFYLAKCVALNSKKTSKSGSKRKTRISFKTNQPWELKSWQNSNSLSHSTQPNDRVNGSCQCWSPLSHCTFWGPSQWGRLGRAQCWGRCAYSWHSSPWRWQPLDCSGAELCSADAWHWAPLSPAAMGSCTRAPSCCPPPGQSLTL